MQGFAVARSVFFCSIYTTTAHSALFPTEAGVCLATSSMSPSKFWSCFSCASALGYCCTNVWCSDFGAERFFVQNIWYPGIWISPILDTILTFQFPPRVPNDFIYRDGAEHVVGTRNNMMFSTQHSALNTPFLLSCLEFTNALPFIRCLSHQQSTHAVFLHSSTLPPLWSSGQSSWIQF
jgi:hypothetical protein